MSGAVERMMLDMADFQRACDTMTCVEVAVVEVVAVRDSKAAENGPVLWFSQAEWAEFVTGAKAGRFDFG
jgi:hypothetical protein